MKYKEAIKLLTEEKQILENKLKDVKANIKQSKNRRLTYLKTDKLINKKLKAINLILNHFGEVNG